MIDKSVFSIQRLHHISMIAVFFLTSAVPLASAEEGKVIEEILVTAQKREQSLSEVPLSVQVVRGEFLDKNNVQSMKELINFVPGAAYNEANVSEKPRMQLRGITQLVGDPTVGFYFGDAPFYYPGMGWAPEIRTTGLERVEVLKGPQSTLYGNGAMGGVIRVIPKKPDLQDVDFVVTGGYTQIDGGDNGYYADASLSVPLLEDKLAVRLSVGEEDSGGWIDFQPQAFSFTTFTMEPSGALIKDYGGNEVSDWRAQVLWQAAENLSIEVVAMHNKRDTSPGGFLDFDGDREISASAVPGLSRDITEYDLYSATITYDFDSFELTSTFSELEYSTDSTWSFTGVFGIPVLILQEPETFINETRIASDFDGAFQFVAGIYYVDAITDSRVEIVQTPALGVAGLLTTSKVDSEQKSVFGEMTYDLTDRWTVLLGLRWFEDERIIDNAAVLPVPSVTPRQDATFDSVNPRFNLAYTTQDDQLYYLNVAKGFRSGSFNAVVTCSQLPAGGLREACPLAIDSDELWSYEVGTKQTLMDGQLFLDVSAYYQDWEDVQGAYRGGSLQASYPIGDADGIGIEFSMSLSPAAIPGLTVQLAANWNNMEFSALEPVIEANMAPFFSEGDGLPGSPDFSASLGINYGWQLSDVLFGDLMVSYNYKSDMLTAVGSTADADSRQFLNGRFEVAFGEHFAIALFGNNLTDEDGNSFAQAGPLYSAPFRMIESPRNFGIEFSYEL